MFRTKYTFQLCNEERQYHLLPTLYTCTLELKTLSARFRYINYPVFFHRARASLYHTKFHQNRVSGLIALREKVTDTNKKYISMDGGILVYLLEICQRWKLYGKSFASFLVKKFQSMCLNRFLASKRQVKLVSALIVKNILFVFEQIYK